MKLIKKISLIIMMLSLTLTSTIKAEKEKAITETIAVNGNCGTCKKTIEKAVHVKGVKEASWDETSKKLTITYLASKISNDDIQHKIADAGYDTEKFKASEDAYNSLHACCKYDRK